MFFKREKARVRSFQEAIDSLRKLGFEVANEPGGGVRVSRKGCAAVVKERAGKTVHLEKAGVLVGSEIGVLADAGFQKFWVTPTDHRAPATYDQLKALHAFDEDLREALGLISTYNESLGTTNELHLYDRVKDRDKGVPKRVWES